MKKPKITEEKKPFKGDIPHLSIDAYHCFAYKKNQRVRVGVADLFVDEGQTRANNQCVSIELCDAKGKVRYSHEVLLRKADALLLIEAISKQISNLEDEPTQISQANRGTSFAPQLPKEW